ncbi:hypothetical protein [Ruegeria sp. HKCCSP351]|uniref:hypothetical protein n=1 Tax=Ruegeria sp. HKCCSP351 TaxID=2794832 RepID=UPI001AE47F2B|nr:hypothetical protein [Ruegeria sp. HKCCSP351]
MAMHKPSTSEAAALNAQLLKKSDSDYDVAMWAACALMALHSNKPAVFREYQHMWAKKLDAVGPHENTGATKR